MSRFISGHILMLRLCVYILYSMVYINTPTDINFMSVINKEYKIYKRNNKNI